MKINTDSQKIEEILTRGVVEVIDKNHLEQKLKSGKQLRVKLGIDPTSPNIHLGRAVPLLKLKDFQELGHKIILIIGDFTGVIGDTSDKDSERPMLSEQKVKENLKTYIEQANKIIDVKECEIYHNSEWLDKLNYAEISKQADVFSLNAFNARENIKKRLESGKHVSLREMLYPLMQGYDSVAVEADVEIGGTDQRFNLLAGRELQRYYKQEPQDIMMNPLIKGLDGRKMSSSWGNTINLFDLPDEMFGKIMSMPDEMIIGYFELLTRRPMIEIQTIKREMESSKLNPRDTKADLAKEIVTLFHNQKLAEEAEEEFSRVFSQKEIPTEMPEIKIEENELLIVDLLIKTETAPSKAEAKRLVEQGGVRLDGQTISDWKQTIKIKDGVILQVGKRRFIKIISQ